MGTMRRRSWAQRRFARGHGSCAARGIATATPVEAWGEWLIQSVAEAHFVVKAHIADTR